MVEGGVWLVRLLVPTFLVFLQYVLYCRPHPGHAENYLSLASCLLEWRRIFFFATPLIGPSFLYFCFAYPWLAFLGWGCFSLVQCALVWQAWSRSERGTRNCIGPPEVSSSLRVNQFWSLKAGWLQVAGRRSLSLLELESQPQGLSSLGEALQLSFLDPRLQSWCRYADNWWPVAWSQGENAQRGRDGMLACYLF